MELDHSPKIGKQNFSIPEDVTGILLISFLDSDTAKNKCFFL